MKIESHLLDSANSTPVGSSTIGKRIAFCGKDHLWDERVSGVIDTIVIHYMSAAEKTPLDPYNIAAVLDLFPEHGVSCHYLITREGVILNLVPESAKAWHCGGSIMPEPDNRTGVNDFSIGIELIGTSCSGFTSHQYDSLDYLCKDIEARSPDCRFHYVGHEHVAGDRAVTLGLRSMSKQDPGPLFDWNYFLSRLKRE